MGGLLLVGFAGSDFVLVEITVGLRSQLQTELIVRILTFRFDLDVVQRDDARQGRDAADELTKLVIAPGEADLNGQLGVEVFLLLALGLEQLLLEAGGQAGREMSTNRLGTSVLPGSCRNKAPNERSMSFSCCL